VLATRVPAALPPPAGLGPVLALVTATPWSALPNTGRPVLRALAPIGANRTDPTVLAAFPLATASALDALRPSVGRRTT
jgi:L-asparagine transporter-like permease